MNITTIILYIISTIIILAISYYIFWKYYFLRDPEREIPDGRNIISPADGKIIDIIEISKNEEITIPKKIFGKIKTLCSEVSDNSIVISIFMNPFDVHINRCPIEGKIINIKHEDGSLKAVNTLTAGILNEKNEMLIETVIGHIKVIQVAGLLARRIENHKKIGDYLNKGERYGLINLGSQLIVILPKEKVILKVRKGDKLKAGESILAKY
jgi:phosphatidylserine decarboxylase